MHYKEEHFSVDEVNEKVLLSFYLLSKGWQKLIMVTFPFDTSMFNRQLPILYTYNLTGTFVSFHIYTITENK